MMIIKHFFLFFLSVSVLILGSGNTVHNLGLIRWEEGAAAYPWAIAFDDWVRRVLESGDREQLLDYSGSTGDAQLAVPTLEHYLPLLYIAGASEPADALSFPTGVIELGSISMLSVLFSAQPHA